jgi:DNA-binding transcriptional ArsR family regulator
MVAVWRERGVEGTGGGGMSAEARGELSALEVAYVVTLNRDGGWVYVSEVGKDSFNASRKLRSIVSAESFF